MENIDLLLTNGFVLTMDSEFHLFEHGAVAIRNDSIIAVGPENQLRGIYKPTHEHNCQGKVIMPGLINAHTHVPMTLLRGLADDLRLDVWLMGFMMPVEREFVSPDFVRLGTQLACAEMIRSGVTCFADMYYYEEAIAEATAKAGMRAVCSQSVLKFPSPDAPSFEDSLKSAREFIQRWKNHPLIVPSIAPHAAYTCTPEILHAAAALAIEFDVPLHTHISETALEVENMRSEQGMPVVPYLKKQGVFEAKVIAAHCVHIDDGEIHTLTHYGSGVSHCPTSNLKLASGVAPVRKMLELGLNVGIGTDGPASNNDLDMFEEIRLAAILAKGITGDPTILPARTALLMGTRQGAQALHISDITGSLEPGKRADIILVDASALHNEPHFQRDEESIYARLVYATKSTDVTDVMINGAWVMTDKQLLTLDEKEILKQSQIVAQKIDVFLMHREKSILSKLIAIGGAMEEESFEVQVKVALTNQEAIINALKNPEIAIQYQRHYQQYDSYLTFEDPEEGLLRFREDHLVNEKGGIGMVRSRLTLIGLERRNPSLQKALLSRSRYFAPATQTLRFYREYFKPNSELEIEKDRLRFLVVYKNTEFYINIDHVTKPDLGFFLEIKSRTWSSQDAEHKAKLTTDLLYLLDPTLKDIISEDYFSMVSHKTK
jgi:5-methylthioadenosine/S-adenosylhomocysteine deaminase